MNEYVKQAKDFLAKANATMRIVYVGLEKPNWDDSPHCTYDCKIKTPRGEMVVHFYDSLHNTEIMTMSEKEWYEKTEKRYFECADRWDKMRVNSDRAEKKKTARPTAYDILACLQKYEVGSMDDFMAEFGYEIKSVKDMTNFINTYNAVVKEYNDLCRIFTEEQMDELREIN